MYVTLEPCSHYGKTPPCTNIIIKNKIKEVVYGVEDIDKKVKGKTLKILKSKNVLVKKIYSKKKLINFIHLISLIEKKTFLMLLVKLQFLEII